VKVYKSYTEFVAVQKAIVTIGTFDGVHLGHQKIIRRIKDLAKKENGQTVILTFYPHPRAVLNPDDSQLKLIDTLDEKIQLLDNLGIDHLIIQPFTKEFSALSAYDFVNQVLVKALGTHILVIGYNHQFGHNREGTLKELEKMAPQFHFKVEKIEKQDVDSIAVSSTQIRKALLSGDVETANLYSGHPFMLKGKVVKGRQLGRTLGFPTANIEMLDTAKIIPADGVYAVMVSVNEKVYKGMLNIGVKPTLKGSSRTIEVYILEFNQDIYESMLTLTFMFRIRDEKKFDSLDLLKEQLNKDKITTTKLLT
jgi:riboflavin kinase/FMN adenylyltransferase